MKKAELKKMIKPLIRECLTEIFMEMNLEGIVERVIRESGSRPVARSRMPQINESVASNVPNGPSREEQKAALRRKLNIGEDEWRSIYDGVVPTSERERQAESPEYATESELEQLGLFRDYSKFV